MPSELDMDTMSSEEWKKWFLANRDNLRFAVHSGLGTHHYAGLAGRCGKAKPHVL